MVEGTQHEPVEAPTTTDVRALSAAVARGDRAALSRLYELQFDRLFRIALAATRRDESFCLDVVQDAFLRIIRALPVLETQTALDAYLRRTVLSCARDRFRRDSRRSAREEVRSRADTEISSSESELPASEVLSRIDAEIAALDDESRFIFESRFRFGWTLARIGSALDLKPGAVDGKLSRIVRRVRRGAEEVIDD